MGHHGRTDERPAGLPGEVLCLVQDRFSKGGRVLEEKTAGIKPENRRKNGLLPALPGRL